MESENFSTNLVNQRKLSAGIHKSSWSNKTLTIVEKKILINNI